jgi:CheY-like chemotaxis protein
VTLPPEPVVLDADPVRLAQVFLNLLTNAAKYTEKGGHIWLTATLEDDKVTRWQGDKVNEVDSSHLVTLPPCHLVTVRVRDTGIGIAPEHLPRLFEMFSQAAPALERSQGGLGIGLSLVKGLVEMHGGRVEARSEGLRKGSEFLVVLPVAGGSPSSQPLVPKTSVRARAWPARRILVADDNRDAANSVALMLRLDGHEVHTAYDGQEAVEAAGWFRPEVVVLDIGMPKLNGYEVCRHIRRQPWGQGIVLIALTGWGQDEDKRRASEAGFDRHLTKPVDPVELERLVAQPTQSY